MKKHGVSGFVSSRKFVEKKLLAKLLKMSLRVVVKVTYLLIYPDSIFSSHKDILAVIQILSIRL